MRGRVFNWPRIGRSAGFLAVAAAMIATLVHVSHDHGRGPPANDTAATAADPVAREIARCRTIGLAAASDAVCEAACAENRRRFFGDSLIQKTPTQPLDRPAALAAGR